jgi:hypothetical protein
VLIEVILGQLDTSPEIVTASLSYLIIVAGGTTCAAVTVVFCVSSIS